MTMLPGPGDGALDRLVLVVGPTRGGTSFVHLALGAHPRLLVIPAELHFLDHVWRYRRRVHDRLWRVLVFQPRAIDRAAVLNALPEDQRMALARHIEATLRAKRFDGLYRLYPRLYALAPEQPKRADALEAWCDKVNDWRGLDRVKRRMPATKVVVVARDPRAVALSHARRERVWQGDGAQPLDPLALARAALHWRFFMQRCLGFAARHQRDTIVVRYEDMVREPAATLGRVFAHAGVEPVPEAALAEALARVRGGATNAATELYQGVSSAPLERWRTGLGAAEAALVEALTAPTARKLGYDIADGPMPWASLPRGVSGRARPGLVLRRLLVALGEPLCRAPAFAKPASAGEGRPEPRP